MVGVMKLASIQSNQAIVAAVHLRKGIAIGFISLGLILIVGVVCETWMQL